MSSLSKPLRLVALLYAATVLSACDIGGIGDGNKLETLEIVRRTALIDSASNASYVCFSDQLQLIGTFSNGGQADYSARGVWRSSNPDVAEVSNGDLRVPGSDTLAYASGTIKPKQAGTTIISADFVGLSASYEVEVKLIPIENFTPGQTDVKLAPETARGLTLQAKVDGYQIDISKAATWTFATPDDTVATLATLSSGIFVIGKSKVGGPLVAQAKLPLCRDENDAPFAGTPDTFKVNVTVEDLASLQLEREFTTDADDRLIVGTSETLKITGVFADGSTQDLASQVDVDSSDAETMLPNALVPQLITALKAGGPVELTAKYGGDDGNDAADDTDPPLVESNTITLSGVEGTLTDFTLTPENSTITALGRQQFTATGTYALTAVSDETLTQPITRHVTWAASTLADEATSIVAISNATLTRGLAASLLPSAGEVKIKATYNRADPDPDLVKDTALCVIKPGDATGACPATP